MRLLFLLLLFTSGKVLSQSQITGKVIDRTLKTPLKGISVFLYLEDYVHGEKFQYNTLEGKDTIDIDPALISIDSMVTDSTGKFTFTVQDNKKYTVDCFIIFDSAYIYWDRERRLGFDDHLNKEIILTLPLFCEFEQYKNQDSCPVCKRKNKCIPVVYGLQAPDPNEPLENLLDIKKMKKFRGGCVYDSRCHARWYCKRCEKLF